MFQGKEESEWKQTLNLYAVKAPHSRAQMKGGEIEETTNPLQLRIKRL